MEILVALVLILNVTLLWWRDRHHTRQIFSMAMMISLLETRLDRAGIAKIQ